MSKSNHQEEIVLTSEDFCGCGWKEILADPDCEDYILISQAFSKTARQATNEDRQAHGKVLSLLAQACSMMLRPESINEPFEPSINLRGWHSPVPEDFSEKEITFFARIADEFDDLCPKTHLLRARLADLVWILHRPRNVKFALMAIDSYRAIPLNKDFWVREGEKCWQRAINLTRMLGTGAGERLVKMEASIIKAFSSATKEDGFLGHWLADLLKSNSLGSDHSKTIARRLETLAHEFENEDELLKAREYFQASAHWFNEIGDDEKSTEMTVEMAETWVKEADARLSSNHPSHMVAASFYESAIQAYRTIPRAQRATHKVDERIAELRRRLNESGEKSLNEMDVISFPGQDISQIVENVLNELRGKTLDEALKTFVNLSHTNVKELRERAMELLHNSSLQAFIPAKFMSPDGRVIAKRPGMNLSTATSNDEEVIRSKMIENYRNLIHIVVRACILPAQEVFLLEHRLREAQFVILARQSSIVPIGRERLFGKALFAGYDRDFGTALYILGPQIEHMVRYHLKQAGVQTTNIDSNGIEKENGLSSLMELPQAEKIFGENLSFEIRALFCDPFGPNLRNEVAHGLLDDRTSHSLEAIYAWWFGLKLVFISFWNALSNDAHNKEQGEKQ